MLAFPWHALKLKRAFSTQSHINAEDILSHNFER